MNIHEKSKAKKEEHDRAYAKMTAFNIMLDDKIEHPEHGQQGIQCPVCAVYESTSPQRINIRAYKVEHGGVWHSHCLICNKWFS